MVRKKAKIRLYKVGTVSKGKFRSAMQPGTGFRTISKAQTAKKFFQSLNKKKKYVIRK